MSIEYLKSTKGKDILKFNGFLYRKDRTHKDKIIWRCMEYNSTKCPGRCHTIQNKVDKFTENHNHVTDVAEHEKRKIIQDIKNRAISTQDSTVRILAASLNVNSAVAAKLPTFNNMKRMIQKTRQKSSRAPGNPESCIELIIPREYTLTLKGEEFLLFDSGPSSDRILIFSTELNLNQLSQSQHWYADGTFKVVPQLFFQLYTIHGVKFNNVIPSVFVLMANKSQENYKRVFEAIKNLHNNLNPLTIMTDFEKGAINAFKSTFQGVINRGCFFHFNQNIWRKIQTCPQILENYLNDSDFALNIRKIAALAFVPVQDIVEAFEKLNEMDFFIRNSVLLEDLLDYFEDNYIGRIQTRNRRRPPKFDHKLWNCFDSVTNGIAKTNNSVEGWHKSFQHLIEAQHPTIWKFINGLKSEQNLNEVKINKYLAGEEPQESREPYVKIAKRLKRIVQTYDLNNLENYLLGIANNFNYNL